eukprot:1710791-Rhodomonas_salina.1
MLPVPFQTELNTFDTFASARHFSLSRALAACKLNIRILTEASECGNRSVNSVNFFICGLPGGLDYLLLGLVIPMSPCTCYDMPGADLAYRAAGQAESHRQDCGEAVESVAAECHPLS